VNETAQLAGFLAAHAVKLADRFLEIANRRIGHETRDLDRNALAASLSADGQPLRAKIDEQPPISAGDQQGIVRDCPAIGL
jgi:hypothetical protein